MDTSLRTLNIFFSLFRVACACTGNLQARSVAGSWLRAPLSRGGRGHVERGEAHVPYLSFEQAHISREAMEPEGMKVEQQVIVICSRDAREGNRTRRRSTTAAAFCVLRHHVLNVLGWFLLGVLFFFSSRRSGRCTRRKDETGWCCPVATAAPTPRARPCKRL